MLLSSQPMNVCLDAPLAKEKYKKAYVDNPDISPHTL